VKMSEYPVETKLKTQETLMVALQGIVSYVFAELAKVDPKLEAAIKAGFENAALSSEVLAMKEGKNEKGQTGLDVLQVIEEFREITFGKSVVKK